MNYLIISPLFINKMINYQFFLTTILLVLPVALSALCQAEQDQQTTNNTLTNLPNDFLILRNHWLEQEFPRQVPGYYLDQAKTILAMQKEDGTFSQVNYADTDKGRWDLRKHWQLLEQLALAYHYDQAGSDYYNAVVRGIDNWSENAYSNRNWWYQSIGIPLLSARVILIMGQDLPADTLQKFRPIFDRSKIGMTAQNRLHLASIHFLKGVIYQDRQMVTEGRDALLAEIAFAAPGKEGLQKDFSFHQHGPQLQFGNYGLEFFDASTRWLGVMRNTSFAASSETSTLLADYFLSGLRWVLYQDLFDFSACGRQIVGDNQSGKFKTARRSANRLLGNISADKNAEAEIVNFFADTSAFSGNKHFYRSDFFVHRRPSRYFSVKMCSSRVIGCESNNTENQRGRYVANAVTQMLVSGEEYRQLMPLWNWRQLPGLTAIQDTTDLTPPDNTHFYLNRASQVGGVSNGQNGATMFAYDDNTLRLNKSYLCFDRYIVAIASDISADSDFPILSTLDSLRLTQPVTVNNKQLDLGNYEILTTSICHGDFTYAFLQPTTVEIEMAEKTADWSAIQPSFKNNSVTSQVLTIRLNHSKTATTGYCYLLLPESDNADNFVLLSSSDSIHAGYDQSAKLGFALFYQPGKITLPSQDTLEMLTTGAIIINNRDLTVADPSQQLDIVELRYNNDKITIKMPQGQERGSSVTFKNML